MPCRGEQLSRRRRHCAVSHVAQQLDELWVLLAADFGEHEAFSDDLGPALGLEAEDGLRAVRVVRGRQLNKGSTSWGQHTVTTLSSDEDKEEKAIKQPMCTRASHRVAPAKSRRQEQFEFHQMGSSEPFG